MKPKNVKESKSRENYSDTLGCASHSASKRRKKYKKAMNKARRNAEKI